MKRKWIILAMICLISVMLCILVLVRRIQEPESTQDGTKPIVFRLAETMPSNHPSAMAAKYFATLVEERSQGKIKIKVYYDGELGTPNEILEQVQFGGIAMARINVLDLTEMVSSLQYYFKPEAYTDANALMEWIGENKEILDDSCQLERFVPLVWYYPDIRCFYSDEESFKKVSDLNNMKIKTTPSNIMKDSMEALGCTAVGTVTMDTYKSLSSGFIDAGETTLSEFVLSDYYRFINYITLSQYMACPDVMVVSTGDFTMLEKSDRDLITKCAQDTLEYEKDQLKEFQDTWTNELAINKQLFIEDEKFKTDMEEIIGKEIGGGAK